MLTDEAYAEVQGFEGWIGSEILKIVMDDVVEISVRSVDRDRGQDRTVCFIDFRRI